MLGIPRDTARLKKHITLLCDRIGKGGRLTLASEANVQVPIQVQNLAAPGESGGRGRGKGGEGKEGRDGKWTGSPGEQSMLNTGEFNALIVLNCIIRTAQNSSSETALPRPPKNISICQLGKHFLTLITVTSYKQRRKYRDVVVLQEKQFASRFQPTVRVGFF